MQKRWLGGLLAAVLTITLGMGMTAWAAEWKQDETGWWYEEDDGSYPAAAWKRIDGKYYYFGADGYMLEDTITPDGCAVGPGGAWMVNNTALASRAGTYTAVSTGQHDEWLGPQEDLSVQRLSERSYRIHGGDFSGEFFRVGENAFQCEKYIQSVRYVYTLSFVGDDALRLTQLDMSTKISIESDYQK